MVLIPTALGLRVNVFDLDNKAALTEFTSGKERTGFGVEAAVGAPEGETNLTSRHCLGFLFGVHCVFASSLGGISRIYENK